MLFISLLFILFINSELFCQQANIYNCFKTAEKIVVDGKLIEGAWEKAPEVLFCDKVNGSVPLLKTRGKMIWDDDYFYVCFECEDPDVWARTGLRDNEVPENLVFPISLPKKKTEWYRLETEIMNLDKFVKISIDPDSDGKCVIEFYINPINNILDVWYPDGERPDESPRVAWTCPGVISAVYIDGTLNTSHDVDRGWSVEFAIPWKSIKFLTKGACPPKPGDIWTGHFCRIHRKQFGQLYGSCWTWPVIGASHTGLMSTLGKIIFCDETKKFLKLFTSGSGDPGQMLAQAKEIGVTDFIAAGDDEIMQKYIEAGSKYGINIYGMIYLNNIDLWKKKYPGTEIPLQVMTAQEQQLKEYFKNKDNRISSGYQMGEMPKARNKEVLYIDLLCFHDERVKNLIREEIDRLIKMKGLVGIMFDFFGYQNYYGCFCPESKKQFEEYLRQHKELEKEKAFEQFSLETLVSFYQEMVSYIKSKSKTTMTMAHIYPVFLPEPFYGNRTGLDYWSQTISWYFPRDILEMSKDTRKMVQEEKEYYANTIGVGMIGYYNRPDAYPFKNHERVEMELKTMLDNGCQYVFVYSLNDVLKSPEIKEIFRRYFAR